MSEGRIHDLHHFMQQLSNEMAAEYNRIQMRATEDPGTAGDQGEENWAKLLRGWLPRTYEVVTKGRIINHAGEASPQVDILVLKSFYPKQLHANKHYLSAGVAAVFECKTRLKASHIEEAMQACIKIQKLSRHREGTPYKDLHSPIVYGLLAHSHNWKEKNSKPENNIGLKLTESYMSDVLHPRWISLRLVLFMSILWNVSHGKTLHCVILWTTTTLQILPEWAEGASIAGLLRCSVMAFKNR